MPQNPTTGRGILAVGFLLVAVVVADVVRRAIPPARVPASSQTAVEAAAGRLRAAAPGSPAPPGRAPVIDSATRSAALRRVAEDGQDTYLPQMLASDDSALRRWGDDRAGRAVSVAVVRGDVPGFRETFVANVAWAVTRWNSVGLPIALEERPDTAGADIVVGFTERLDSNRTGRSDVTWRRDGPIVHVVVTLATHTPDGAAVVPRQMVALALHELGHALGLGHSPVRTDALYPETSAADLTARDRRTARLLYALPAGSLKQ